jgi:hypothetical protein
MFVNKLSSLFFKPLVIEPEADSSLALGLTFSWWAKLIERGLERACTLCFSSFEHAKTLLIMGPNSTKN